MTTPSASTLDAIHRESAEKLYERMRTRRGLRLGAQSLAHIGEQLRVRILLEPPALVPTGEGAHRRAGTRLIAAWNRRHPRPVLIGETTLLGQERARS